MIWMGQTDDLLCSVILCKETELHSIEITSGSISNRLIASKTKGHCDFTSAHLSQYKYEIL